MTRRSEKGARDQGILSNFYHYVCLHPIIIEIRTYQEKNYEDQK